jgi:hypothetical protein
MRVLMAVALAVASGTSAATGDWCALSCGAAGSNATPTVPVCHHQAAGALHLGGTDSICARHRGCADVNRAADSVTASSANAAAASLPLHAAVGVHIAAVLTREAPRLYPPRAGSSFTRSLALRI